MRAQAHFWLECGFPGPIIGRDRHAVFQKLIMQFFCPTTHKAQDKKHRPFEVNAVIDVFVMTSH